MPFNVNEFRSVANINSGFQKLNKYLVRIPVPPGLLNDFQSRNNGSRSLLTARHLEFQCHTADLPGIGLGTRPIVRYGYGASEKKPFAPIYQDVMMTFYADANDINLQFFHEWFRLICHNDMGHSISEPKVLNGTQSYPWELAYIHEYAVDAAVRLYDTHGKQKYEIEMREFFPIAIPETKLVWEPVQQIMSIVVMFTYYDWSIKRDRFDDDPVPVTVAKPTDTADYPDWMLKNNVW